jgi:hypothetical protein
MAVWLPGVGDIGRDRFDFGKVGQIQDHRARH